MTSFPEVVTTRFSVVVADSNRPDQTARRRNDSTRDGPHRS